MKKKELEIPDSFEGEMRLKTFKLLGDKVLEITIETEYTLFDVDGVRNLIAILTDWEATK